MRTFQQEAKIAPFVAPSSKPIDWVDMTPEERRLIDEYLATKGVRKLAATAETTIEMIRRMHQEGASAADIATHIGTNEKNIRSMAANAGINLKQKKTHYDDNFMRQVAKYRLETGKSFKNIGKHFKCSERVVTRAVKKYTTEGVL